MPERTVQEILNVVLATASDLNTLRNVEFGDSCIYFELWAHTFRVGHNLHVEELVDGGTILEKNDLANKLQHQLTFYKQMTVKDAVEVLLRMEDAGPMEFQKMNYNEESRTVEQAVLILKKAINEGKIK